MKRIQCHLPSCQVKLILLTMVNCTAISTPWPSGANFICGANFTAISTLELSEANSTWISTPVSSGVPGTDANKSDSDVELPLVNVTKCPVHK